MSRLIVITAMAVAMVLSGGDSDGLAQDAAAANESQGEVLLIKLFQPVYPPIALTARVSGDVDVLLGIGHEGNVESASVVSGPQLLSQAALNSAQQSQFKCVGCTEAVTSYHVIYAFRLGETIHCTTTTSTSTTGPDEPRSSVTQSLNHVTVFDTPIGTCDLAPILGRKVRAAKCLYLWRCALRTS
jgi:hypothetical protein